MPLPDFSQFLNRPDVPPVNAPPQPTGTGNWFTAGLGSGFHTALSEAGSAGEAVGRAIGADHFADNARAFADAQRESAATYARPDLENAPWYDPQALAYRVTQGLPTLGGAVLAAGAAGLAAPESGLAALAAGGAAMLPSAIGGNVQRREDYQGDLDAPNAWKAIALGVPEAALQGALPLKLEQAALKGTGFLAGRGMVGTMARAGAIQAPVAASTEWLTQQMGDPNRTFANKAQDIITAGLTGGVLGAATGGALHPLSLMPTREIAKVPAQNVDTNQLNTIVGQSLAPPQPLPYHAPAPGDIVQAQIARAQAALPQDLPLPSPAEPQPPAPPVFGRGANGMVGAPEQSFTPLVPAQPMAPRMDTPVPPPATFGQRLPTPPETPEAPFDWTAQRKQLQQGKAYSNILKGPFGSQDELVQTVAENYFNRVIDDATLPRSLVNAARMLRVIDDNGEPTPAFAKMADDIIKVKAAPQSLAPDSAVEPDLAGPTPGAFTPPQGAVREAVPVKHQGRWDGLEDVRNRLLGDNLSDPDVQQMLQKTADLQNQLIKPGNSYRTIEAATKSLQTQVAARDAEATAQPASPPVDKRAPAQGPDPSPPAAAVIAKAQPEAVAPMQTKEAQVKAALAPATASVEFRGKTYQGASQIDAIMAAAHATGVSVDQVHDAVVPEPTPVKRTEATVKATRKIQAGDGTRAPGLPWLEDAPASLKAKDAQEAVANGEAPAGVTPDEIKAQTTNPAFPNSSDGLPSRENGIERDGRYWDQLSTSYPTDIEARAQMAEDQAKQEGLRNSGVEPSTMEARAKQARQAMLARREPVDPAARGDIENQRTPEVVKPKLAASVDEVKEAAPARELDPTNSADRKVMARQQTNAEQPPAVDPSQLSGFARDGRRLQADVRRESMNDGLRARLAMVESGRRPVVPVPPKVQAQLQSARDAMTKLQQSGAIIPRHEDFAGKDQRFQQLLTQHREQLDLSERAARLGGMEGLREIPRDYFGTDLYDEMSGHVTPQTEKNLEQHATAESQIQDAASMARGERPLIKYSMPPTQHDVDLTNIINKTGDMKTTLGYIRDQGTSTQAREMANILLKGGAGGTIEMSDKAPITSRQVQDGEYVAGQHFSAYNHTRVYDGGGVEGTVLHEAVHAVTTHALEAGGPAAQEMNALFDRVKMRSGDNDTYGLENTHEFVAEAMSNPQFQQFLKSQNIMTGSRISDMWNQFKNVVFRALGMPNRIRTLFDQTMDISNRLMGENVAEASRNTNLQVQRGGQQFSEVSTQVGDALIRKYQRTLDDKATGFRKGARDIVLGFEPGQHLEWQLKDRIPAVVDHFRLEDERGTRADMLSMHSTDYLQEHQELPKSQRDALTKIEQSSIQNIDGSIPWKDNTWLYGDPQEAVLKQEHARLVHEFDVLRGGGGKGMEVYQKGVDTNETSRNQRYTSLLYDAKMREWVDEQWSGYDTDPMRDYRDNDRARETPALARQFTEARKLQMVAGAAKKAVDLETLINSLKVKEQAVFSGAVKMTPEQHQELRDQIKTQTDNREVLMSLIGDISAGDERAKQGPYFHLGRDGDHYVSGHIITDNGVPNDAALVQLRDRMEAAGLGEHMISRGVGNSAIYLRMRGEAQREEAFHLFNQLVTEGVLDASPKKAPVRGLSSDKGFSMYNSVGPAWMRQAIEAVKAQEPEYPVGASQQMMDKIDAAHDQQQREMTRSLMAMLPDTSITKIYAKRENVQGFNSDMMASYKAAAISSARGLSSMSLAREMGQTTVQMSKQMRALGQNNTISGRALTATAQGLGELALRSKSYQANVPSNPLDFVRRAVHTYQIGASPAYFLTLMSQFLTTTLPELAKTHGYARSAMAMGKVTSESFQIMRAVLESKDRLTFGIRRAALEAKGINPATIDFIMNLASRGAFNHGAFTESVAGHDTDSTYGKIQQYANMLGRYSEQFPRVLTALAARELHQSQPGKAGGLDVHQFAYNKVAESQGNWSAARAARQTTRAGNFGVMSPMINQFMGWQILMTSKLYREVATGLGSATRGTEGGRQARTWLYGHAAATAMLAGTLGLPMVSVAASVYDALADWATNSDDHDVTASYRNFLAQSFGKEFGEAVARGAPRLAGMDFDHLGEGAIAPGSSMLMFMTEKRKWEDAEKDWLKNMSGASMGFIFKGIAAARDIHNGDIMDGMIKAMPEIFKGPLEALRLGERGFTDKNGFKLPITADATDIMMTALGIDPEKEAEYDEMLKVSRGYKTLTENRSQNITRHLMLAVNRNDPGMMQSWQREAMKFQTDHPGMQSPMMDFERAMTMHERNAAEARGMGTPIGVQPRDVVGRGMAAFGNLR